MFSLVLGGVKSGKSNFALKLLKQERGAKAIIVTGKGLDFSFKEQIKRHRLEREPELVVWESDLNLAFSLEKLSDSTQNILIEGLDFWFFSLTQNKDYYVNSFLDKLLSLTNLNKKVILVSCEMGLGLFPTQSYSAIREMGDFNQKLARICSKVYLVVAGCALKIKDE